MTSGGGERDLGLGADVTAQGVNDRQAKMRGQFGGLVEAAAVLSAPVQRDRHGQIRLRQEILGVPLHELRQWSGKRPAAVVLERVHDRAKRSLVWPDRSSAVERPRDATTSDTPLRAAADGAPRRQRIPAPPAERWGEGGDGRPALRADGAAGRLGQQAVAGRTARGDQRSEEGVGNPTPVHRSSVGLRR
tara:strand:+ start:1224 stop:1793 length:570 start_codon:yes stop_codon:yes gene_type:complete